MKDNRNNTPSNGGSNFPGLKTGAVVAAHPLAVKAGRQILEQGGNAIDAAIATSFALNVVEPHASGMGGGGFMLIYPAQGEPVFLDYREKTPGKYSGEYCSKGGQAVAIPGQMRGVEKALSLYGSMPLKELVAPAAKLARDGFQVSKVFTGLLEPRLEVIQRCSAMAEIFLDNGKPPKPGFTLTQPDLAKTLEAIGEEGADYFYTGPLARDIADAVQGDGGVLDMEDMANYQVRILEPLKGSFGRYTVLTAAPPSTGGTNMLQLLGIWDQRPCSDRKLGQVSGIDYLARAMGYVFRDQDLYMGDPAHVDIPMDKLISPEYLGQIAKDITGGQTEVAADHYQSSSTTNLVTADKEGNVVVMTQTINHFFGAGLAVPGRGIILNNEVADFTPEPDSPNKPAANKTPLSNMAPTIVLDGDRIVLALGSPGAKRIVTALGQVLLMYLEGGLGFKEAVEFPRFHSEGSPLHLEEDLIDSSQLEDLGHRVRTHSAKSLFFGGVTGLAWEKNGPIGVFDSRRDGDKFIE